MFSILHALSHLINKFCNEIFVGFLCQDVNNPKRTEHSLKIGHFRHIKIQLDSEA